MKRALYILPALLLLWSAGFFVAHAQGNGLIYQQTASNALYTVEVNGLYFTFTAANSGKIIAIDLRGAWCGYSGSMSLTLETSGGSALETSSSTTPSCGVPWQTWNFSGNTSLAGGTSYRVLLNAPGGELGFYNNSGIGTAYYSSPLPEPTISVDGTAAPTDSISISNFIPTSATGAFWQVNYTAASTTSYEPYTSQPYYTIYVYTGNTSSTPQATLTGLQDQASTDSGVSVTSTIATSQAFTPGITYYAQATMTYHPAWNSSVEYQVASSSIFSFSVAATTSLGYFLPPTSTITSSTPSIQVTCDPNSGVFQYSLCNLAQALFVPTPDSANNFQNLIGLIKNKPPIGYFTLIVSDLQGINASSTPTLVVLASSTLSAFSGVFGVLDEYIGIGVVLLFMWWLFHRFRHFQL